MRTLNLRILPKGIKEKSVPIIPLYLHLEKNVVLRVALTFQGLGPSPLAEMSLVLAFPKMLFQI